MNRALVIGNGRSRLQFDLQELKKSFTTYGCNALYRDFIPDYLVSMDEKMVDEIIRNNAHKQCKFYTQHMNHYSTLITMGEPINFIRSHPSTPDSGTAAIELACKDHDVIVLLGFDYHNGEHNNVYAGTHNYMPNNYAVPFTQDANWKSALHNLIRQWPKKTFVRITDEPNLTNLPNYSHMSLESFKECP